MLQSRRFYKELTMFTYSYNNKRYHTLDYYYKTKYKEKVFKIPLNGNFTCPNIDGTVGTKGCIYCSKSGSGEFAGNKKDDIIKQFEDGKKMMLKKWPKGKYIGYFQARTNTYAPVEKLKELYEPILKQKDVVGLNIATRPDSISEECYKYLEDLNKRTDLTVELGLQTIKEETLKFINRGHTLECFKKAVEELRKRNINVVVHIINGLPNETKEDMINTVKYLNKLDIQGIKIHMLSITKDTELEKYYNSQPFQILSQEDYIDIVISQLEHLRPEIVIHRITGDPKLEDLIEPKWLIKKVCVINNIDKEMVRRDTYQGAKC
ncbi:MAG: TIGR01212 family radical SAM protein [Bacilli bacterium]|nr:TIGR01212 family radical SAM protein [Bacilli bacterium]